MTHRNTIHAPPRATAMIEALRGLGYSVSTAIADIVDNSIAAGATHVDIRFTWSGAASAVMIQDDGRGMSRAELVSALRLGDRNPNDEREDSDLGRFGLGLKTASFSQARRLTVISSDGKASSCLGWDLDLLANSEDDGWYMVEGPADDSMAKHLTVSRGTIVLWEKLDRIVTPGFKEQDLLDLMDVVERHLAMVFHRFMSGPGKTLTLTINDRAVQPWDPFLLSHPATMSSPVVHVRTAHGVVAMQSHVLPHKDKLDAKTLDAAAGPDGWTAQQGFYVYRNRRLLVAGSWLGLGRGRMWTKEEAHRLARLRVDIPNTADADWKIDIRKSVARPPVQLKEHLTRLAEDARAQARKVFASRGTASRGAAGAPVIQAWNAEHFKGGMRYRIAADHPAVRAVLDEAGSLRPAVEAMLRVIEETVPVQRIWLDTTEAKETPRTGFAEVPASDILSVLRPIHKGLLRKGLTPSEARQRLATMEPFHLHPDLVAGLPDSYPEKE